MKEIFMGNILPLAVISELFLDNFLFKVLIAFLSIPFPFTDLFFRLSTLLRVLVTTYDL